MPFIAKIFLFGMTNTNTGRIKGTEKHFSNWKLPSKISQLNLLLDDDDAAH